MHREDADIEIHRYWKLVTTIGPPCPDCENPLAKLIRCPRCGADRGKLHEMSFSPETDKALDDAGCKRVRPIDSIVPGPATEPSVVTQGQGQTAAAGAVDSRVCAECGGRDDVNDLRCDRCKAKRTRPVEPEDAADLAIAKEALAEPGETSWEDFKEKRGLNSTGSVEPKEPA